MVGYHKTAPADTPSCAGVGARGVSSGISRLWFFLSGTGRGTGGGLMVGYHKSAPADTPSCAGLGLRGAFNCTTHQRPRCAGYGRLTICGTPP